jgi:hypothetical protein
MQQGRGNWDAPSSAAAKLVDQGGMDVEPDGKDAGGYLWNELLSICLPLCLRAWVRTPACVQLSRCV